MIAIYKYLKGRRKHWLVLFGFRGKCQVSHKESMSGKPSYQFELSKSGMGHLGHGGFHPLSNDHSEAG